MRWKRLLKTLNCGDMVQVNHPFYKFKSVQVLRRRWFGLQYQINTRHYIGAPPMDLDKQWLWWFHLDLVPITKG